MILLSALLASLTGLVAGERPAPHAQVELSAGAIVARAGEAAARVQSRPAAAPALPLALLLLVGAPLACASAPARRLRARLSLKQSWLN